ncbi:MAG TPA: monofunctional biosynthetic peptidoglycan transglycosylase [Chitinophagales bacterium]|nr:monofunctional biosynthetic peptidoglycan transglycosylase [Chitinophagales bacterium]
MLQRFFQLLLKIALSFLFITFVWVLIYKFVPIPITMTMVSNSIENMGTDEPVFFEKDWKSLDQISAQYIKAVIASEDQKFYLHNGFDMEAIEKAIEHNSRNADRIKGGSTISQQTAKNAFLWQGRSYIRKGLEVYFTLLIELLWSKERIMEVYLNIAEMGNGIYGVQAASLHYFNKDAIDITKSEAALVAAILPSPKKYSAKNPGPYVRKRQQWISRQMNNVQWQSAQ